METIGAYDAKTHFSELLEKVAKGKQITITRHGVPVALLQPVRGGRGEPVADVIEQIKRFRRINKLDGLSIREMIEEGRR